MVLVSAPRFSVQCRGQLLPRLRHPGPRHAGQPPPAELRGRAAAEGQVSGQGSESPSPHGTGRGRPVLPQEFLEGKPLLKFFPSRFQHVTSNMYFKTARGCLASRGGPTVWLCRQVRDRLVQPLPPQAEVHPPSHDPAHPAPGAQVPAPPVSPARGRLCLAQAIGPASFLAVTAPGPQMKHVC